MPHSKPMHLELKAQGKVYFNRENLGQRGRRKK